MPNTNNRYKIFDLVSDNSTTYHTPKQDTNLINAWGIVKVDNSLWVAANGKGLLLHYTFYGSNLNPITGVNVPSAISLTGGSPTGLIVNCTKGYLTPGSPPQPSLLITCTKDGLICAYNPNINYDEAIIVKNYSEDNSVFTGLAMCNDYLYVVDFYNNEILVFDYDYNQITNLAYGPFIDKDLHNPIPSNFAVYNIANIENYLFVSYAEQNTEKNAAVSGNGNGYISIFKADGTFVRRLVSQGFLNSPWAMAIAPCDFGIFEDQLLVGCSGDGYINVYKISKKCHHAHLGEHIGTLRNVQGQPIVIQGIWGITEHHKAIYVASGPNNENDGLIAKIKP